MKPEKLNLSNSKGKLKIAFASGCLITILLIVLVNIIASKALYRKTESVQLASGTVNYTPYDFKIMAMYQEKKSYSSDSDKYEEIKIMPGSEYVINETKSYCTLDNQKHDTNAVLKTFEGRHIISHLTKQDKCYLYFDKEQSAASKTVFNLGLKTEGAIDKITGPSCSSGCKMNENGLYYAGEDDDGPSYVFRGTVDNNWVKFGQTKNNEDIWWRIIRINGDGSIRLIYSGEGENFGTTGNEKNAIDNQTYNSQYNDNTYVGFTNTDNTTSSYETAHNGSTKSTILTQLDSWFTGTKLDEAPYINEIDSEAGFCNDRGKSTVQHRNTSFNNEGYGNKPTWYAPFDRVAQSDSSSSYSTTEQKPTLKCTNKTRDLYTVSTAKKGNKKLTNSVGLITMDEVIYAGGFAGQNNNYYWLYTNQYFWTMSPIYFNGSIARVFYVYTDGTLASVNVHDTRGVRPVINLKPDKVTLREPSSANKGTTSNPYIVSD